MTTVAVLCDPPRDGLVLPQLADTSVLSVPETTELYTAMLKDICRAIETSGGELLINYRPEPSLPNHEKEGNAEADVRAVVADALSDPDDARYERQVGQTFSGRAGNTATHLLERETKDSVAIVTPNAILSRKQIDTAAMKLRRSPIVLGPTSRGRVYYAGFTRTIDFADAYTPPAIETLTDRAVEAGHEVDFIEQAPLIETGIDLAETVALLRARQRAGRIVPQHTIQALDGYGLTIDDGTPRLTR